MSGDRINSAIPSLINGVSQQPTTMRLESQGDLQINGLSSVVDGLIKRPYLAHMRKIMEEAAPDAFFHAIKRDRFERYFICGLNGTVRVFDLLDNGREIPVAYPDGKEYLACQVPREDFAVVTVADHSFLVNRRVTTAMMDLRTPPLVNEAIAYVKRGYVSTTYKIMVNDTWVTHKTKDPYTVTSATSSTTSGNTTTNGESTTTSVGTQPSTEEIATDLADQINAIDGFAVETLGSCLRIRRTDGEDFTFRVTDSWGEEALIGVKREVMKFNDLPAKCWDGVTVRITGENVGKDDDYYVVYNSEGAAKNGTWDETRGWDCVYAIDPATMPHLLVREADGTFTFRRASWEEAGVGDEYSIENPSFIGSRIADIVFYRNRLGIIANENVALSGYGEYFNYWPQSATTQVDTDVIDVASGHDDDVSMLHHGVPFRDALLLFSDQNQFQLTDGGATALSPATARIDPTTSYHCSRFCKPVGAGQNVYFVTESGDNSVIQEYFVAPDSVGYDADDVTGHVPRYIPKGVYRMVASSNETIKMLLSTEVRNEIYVYRYRWAEEGRKAQSSWSIWRLPETDVILTVANIESKVYAVIQRSDGIFLEVMDIQSKATDPGLDFQVLLDRRVKVTGVYNSQMDKTTWTLPYVDTEELAVILGGGFSGRGGAALSHLEQTGNTISANGDYSLAPCYIGRNYTFRYRFSEQFVKESREVGAPVIKQGRLQLLNFMILHHRSGYFRSEVTSKGREPVVKEHLGTIGELNFRIGKPVIDSEPHRFGVMAKSDQVTIELVNDRHFPSNFQSAEWIGLFVADARRI